MSGWAPSSDGTITAWHVKILADFGAYNMILTPLIPSLGAFVMGGCYDIPNVRTDIVGVFTNKCPTDAIRGAGRPEATQMIEVTIDQLAHELGIDPLEIRRKNFIAKERFPAAVATGVIYDSGDYHATLDKLLEHVDVAGFRAEQAKLREQGIYRGIGFCTWTEICGLAPSRITGPAGVGVQAGLWESAMVRVHNTGAVTVYSGTSPHGQGLDTAFAQIVADQLGIDPAVVEVIHGDTSMGPEGRNTYGSRSLATGGEAIVRATNKVVEKAKAIVAAELEAAAGGHRGRRRPLLRSRARPTRGWRSPMSPGSPTSARCPRGWSRAWRRRRSMTRRTSCSRSARTRASSTSTSRRARRRSFATSRSTTAATRSTRC